jgi:RNA polymerase sigma-70 factor (ECF subfamily)
MAPLNQQTITLFQAGDENAFRQVFEHYYPALLAFIRKLTGSHEEAEDISLNAFQALFNRCHAFETEINIKAFLYICGRNSSLNYLRAKQRDKQQLRQFAERMADDTFLEFEFAIKPGIVAAIHKAIEELPGECRKIFKLLYFDELTPKEIADLLQVTVSTVYNQKSRAIHALRMKFSENAIVVLWLLQAVAFQLPPFSYVT